MHASCPPVQNSMAADDDLPPGYKFRPDTEQLLTYYLRPKLDGEDFPQELVPFCDLYGKQEPWQIWDKYFQELAAKDQERTDLYFITQHKTKTPKGKRISRTVGSGTWKGEDAPSEIKASSSKKVIGKRRRFRYESNNKDSEHNGGRWLMHEFELDASLLRNKRKAKDVYVLCILRKKNRSVKKNSEDQDDDEMSCDGGDDHEQDGDLPVPEPEFVQEETSNTSQRSDEHTRRGAVESEVYQQSAGQAVKTIDHNDLQKKVLFRKWAMEMEEYLVKQKVDQAMKKNDHKDSPKMRLEEIESLLMNDDY